MSPIAITVGALLLLAGIGSPARAGSALEVPSAYRVVAAEYGVPPALLFAVALTESARPAPRGVALPWPWVLNVRGEPRWYASRTEAAQDLTRLLARGEHPDVGLMQVNWRYHATLLSDPKRAIDPWLNLRTGAAVLTAEYRDTDDWWRAVGRYHSRDPDRAARYTQRVRDWYGRVQ